ncbi:unnamed protein product [Effrenium voratum]|nr:unnamed protein product [Effrenium voratum]
MAGRSLACGAALSGAMLVAPSFVAPAVQAPRVLPSSQQAQSASHGSVDLSSVAVAGVAASSLVAARNARKGSKTMCHFFGGSSAPSGFDPAKEMGVQETPLDSGILSD